MRIDSFTTARCNKCGWIKQFTPSKEYESSDWQCNCVKKEEPKEDSKRDNLMNIAKRLGLKVPHNIGEDNLKQKIREVQDGQSKNSN